MIKRIYRETNIREIFKGVIISSIILLFFRFIILRSADHYIIHPNVFVFTLLAIIWIVPIIVAPLVWYFTVKPKYDHANKQIQLNKKYNQLLKSFNGKE